jgi:hypothetical protein
MTNMRFNKLTLWLLAITLTVPIGMYGQDAAEDAKVEESKSKGASEDLKSNVLEWVDELDAPSLAKRKAAEQSLIEVGPDALQFLPETKAGISIEAAERLTRVRKALQSMRTETETKSGSIRIRLNDVTTLGEALEAISRDSGIEFEYDGDESMAISPVEAPLSFWHAIDLVLDQAGLDINFYGGDVGTLQLTPRNPERPSRVDSAAYTGVYRIEPTMVTARRNLSNPTMNGLSVGVEISWEPRLTPIGLTIPIAQLTGRLNDDAILKPQESGETIDVATNSDIAFSEFYLPLKLPAGQPDKIEALSGIIRALLPGKQQTFELSLAEPNSKKTIDAMTVQIEAIRKNGPLHEIRVGVELQDADRSLESHRHWIFENEVHVKLKDGSRADHLGYEVYRQTESNVGIGYLFDLGDAVNEATFIYKSPTAVVPNEVPFVIQDIALP